LIREAKLSGRGVGFEAHHLLEKQFASRLGIAEEEIISVALTPKWHRNLGGMGTNLDAKIMAELARMNAPAGTATVEQIWKAHRNVYERLGQPDWAHAIYDAYFSSRGIPYNAK
jgi:hypothetical protein